jgi:uncharacterized protein
MAQAVAHRLERPSSEPLAPVRAEERISSVDTLRGFALLGILPINIVAFALPLAAYVTPMNEAVNAYRGPFHGLGAAAWLVPHFVCDLKMMTIFSMLFGAGLVLMNERAARREGASGQHRTRFAVLYYRRLGILALIGLFHGFVIWYGDILFYYALSGALLYPLRNLRARTLIVIGLVLFAGQIGLNRWEGRGVERAHQAALQAERAGADHDGASAAPAAARSKPGDEETQDEAGDEWESIQADHDPTPEQVADEIARVRGSAASSMSRNTELILYNLTSSELAFWFSRALTAMLLGMGMLKLGILSARRSARFYAGFSALGYAAGLPLVWVGVWQLSRHRFEPVYMELVGRQYNFVGSLFVALGHVGLVMLVCKRGWLRWWTKRLAAVGQMALTNYLSQSIVGAALFSGWGLGLFARLTHPQLLLVVAAIWIAQLAFSSFWLARFRYGPAEWLWRSATYGSWGGG